MVVPVSPKASSIFQVYLMARVMVRLFENFALGLGEQNPEIKVCVDYLFDSLSSFMTNVRERSEFEMTANAQNNAAQGPTFVALNIV